ncbi:MAG: hypothetical protein K6G71_02470 [Clostridiales bacterium]|nr:hypothetical protein [Clostridiales bacterium]
MVTKRRFAVAILAALILVAVTASLFVVLHEAGHECIGEGCPICAVVSVCRNVLKTLSVALAVFAAAAASGYFAVFFITVFNASLHKETPVSLKVKLLD